MLIVHIPIFIFVKNFSHLVEQITYIIQQIFSDNWVNPMLTQLSLAAKKLDYLMNKQSEIEIETLDEGILTQIKKILIHHEYKLGLNQINLCRENAIKSQANNYVYLENIINLIALVGMEIVINQQTGINQLEKKIEDSVKHLIEKTEHINQRNFREMRKELSNCFTQFWCSPFDKCKQRLGVPFKPGFLLTDGEVYQLHECYQLQKLTPNTPIDEVIKIYETLQQNARIIAVLESTEAQLQKQAMADWLKYSMLIDFWHDTIISNQYSLVVGMSALSGGRSSQLQAKNK